MSRRKVSAGFIPLTDAAPLIIARELGFADEEGLDLTLKPAPSWSTLRDMLAVGAIDAAHMLSPVPIAMSLGLGGIHQRVDALSVLSINGDVIGVSNDLSTRMRAAGFAFDFANVLEAGRTLVAATPDGLRIGVPFPFSMHAELLFCWLTDSGLISPDRLKIKTVPPPLMAQAMADGEIDAFCVGEPWGSETVERGHGELLLPGAAIWKSAPEKVLAVRHDWAEVHSAQIRPLLRSLWRAARWLADSDNSTTAAEILSRAEYLNVSSIVVDRALTGRLVVSQRGEVRQVPDFLRFHAGAATFPWRSQAAWIGRRLAERHGLNVADAMAIARQVFRSDIYRDALRDSGAILPGASEKVEGIVEQPLAAASETGRLILEPDGFFDGRIFDPDTSM
ncbi:ABC transporter substrate-binding protein [Qingshengfaniella alkalisoli]|uniref:ABC transporter substrate-binding protein n=1 Tax=Qingshengfaniella alkalisoli TaxID=2599296 RepID=A0A5B8ITP2_9RHOB|nr:ABC transporter substrate-binding protein [Qingshengfaniella alkalisoli]QDY68833.1 ABC transporter substrate-binding protein [Qingshengfaniella alkalisoli]